MDHAQVTHAFLGHGPAGSVRPAGPAGPAGPDGPATWLGQADPLTEACGPPETATYVCRRVFEWTESEFLAAAANWLVGRPLAVIVIIVGAWFLNRIIRRGIRRFVAHAKDESFQRRVADLRRKTGVGLLDTGPLVSTRRAQRADAIGAVLRSIMSVVIYTLAVFMALGQIGLNLGPLIAGAGIIGIALGFGAQSLVKDFLSGLFMIIEDQFGVGDIIDVGEAVGVVEGMSLRTTRIRDVEGAVWHVPNGEILRVANKSQQWARALLDVEVAYDTDLEEAKRIIKHVADQMWQEDEWRPIILEEPEIWGIQELGASGIAIRLVIKTHPGEQWNLQRQIRGRIKEALDAAGIEIPFPQRTVWHRYDGEPPPGADPASGAGAD